jgi:hypothetical protein
MVKENMYKSSSAINQPLTGRVRRGQEDVCRIDYGIWIKTAQDEERMCREESVK